MCDGCKTRQRCEKRLTVHRWPPILVVHIKRFQYNSYTREKLATSVKFPLRGLDINSFLSHPTRPNNNNNNNSEAEVSSGGGGSGGGVSHGSSTYDLYGVSNHMGGLGGGHYTASCKHDHLGGKWFYYNDSNVTPIGNDKELQSSVAYVLFYKQRTHPS